ncbi:hypothetical protein Vretimale_4884 [Volvox reticuliferus]|uniref:Uncharacterized protein n=1 Tax=Volvox reticuliferus TaxID=1737510 RepID=A0A8J4G4K6_9CHLO|nr:hypothetical protein Vretifemale_3512 [Volvox reticuliferus]GIL99757.1 hypothetical protein Vretimale_4884 [Volvox reticuliferus]
MGRPFILYEEADMSDLSPSTSTYQTYEMWSQAAIKALDESEIVYRRASSNPAMLAILEYLFSKRRVAFLPICEPAPDRFLSIYESKIGGVPYLLPSESWPCNNGRGLTHLWQLRVRDLPAAVRQALGYSQGLLQVFLSESLDEDEGKWYLVRVLDEGQIVYRDASEIVLPPDVNLLDQQRVTSFRCAYDFPLTEDALAAMPGGLDDGMAIYVINMLQEAGLYSTLPGDKLLGWPRWCQNPEWRLTDEGEAYVQLMQIEDSVAPFTVGTGTLLLQRHPTDRQQWDASWACC